MNLLNKIFLNCNKNLPELAAKRLLEYGSNENSFIDYSRLLVAVTGKEAVRKILAKLTELGDKQHKGILPPKIVTADYLLSIGIQRKDILSPIERKMLWIDILKNYNLTELTSLFPVAPYNQQDINWLTKTSSLIIELITKLAENGYTIADIYTNHGDDLYNDLERWQDLAKIEKAYIDKLNALCLKDPDYAKIEASISPAIPHGFTKLILIGVIDPIPIVYDAVNKISQHINTELWIYTEEKYSQYFDQFGRPTADFWIRNMIDIPYIEDKSIYVESLPEQQGKRTADIVKNITNEEENLTSDDISVFAINKNLIPYIETSLNQAGFETFDPSGLSLNNTELCSLIQCVLNFIKGQNYYSLAELFRNIDFLKYLKTIISDFNIEALLKNLDLFQNKYKPSTIGDIQKQLKKESKSQSKYKIDCKDIISAFTKAVELTYSAKEKNFCDYVTDVIHTIYQGQNFTSTKNIFFIKSSEKINNILNEFKNSRINVVNSLEDNIFLFNEYLEKEKFYSEHFKNTLQIQGWLEVLWSDSKYMVFAGMNEEYIPTTENLNIFLPESLKEKLGLRNNKTNFARDTYIFSTLLSSRKQRVTDTPAFNFIIGRWDLNGYPLKPSRLFYLSDDKTFMRRIGCFWGTGDEYENAYDNLIPAEEANASFKLNLYKNDFNGEISVSELKIYLQSPLMFYLRCILKMKTVDDSLSDIDSSEFGIICHKALEELANKIKTKLDERIPSLDFMKKELIESAENYVETMYGKNLPLSFLIALDSIKSRLSKAAEIYQSEYEKGWRTIYTELPLKIEISQEKLREWLKDNKAVLNKTYIIKGRIDRIDRNTNTGEIRVIDYKTSDTENNPEKAHYSRVLKPDSYADTSYILFNIKGTTNRWKDFQLPLYYIILKEQSEFKNATISCAYFNLPSSLDKVGISLWDKNISEYVESVKESIAKIIQRIDLGIYQPSGKINSYDMDEFKKLFHDDPDKYIDYSVITGPIKDSSL